MNITGRSNQPQARAGARASVAAKSKVRPKATARLRAVSRPELTDEDIERMKASRGPHSAKVVPAAPSGSLHLSRRELSLHNKFGESW